MLNLQNPEAWKNFLLQVKKPTRYLGNEINAVVKEWLPEQTKIALVFPDLYEIGMSHLGLKILYHLLNTQTELLAERVFAPAADMEALLKNSGVPLFSLENHRPLRDFDVVGFTLQYEMAFSNILNLLHLGGIPFYAAERDESYPLIIGGGSGVANPEPLAPFFDCFLIGDGEELFLDFLKVYRQSKAAGLNKKALLKRLAAIPGVYVPAFYDLEYAADGSVSNFTVLEPGAPEKITRVIVKDLDAIDFPRHFIVPYLDIVHDRLNVEINRGCTRGCRFCQAGMFYRPVRHRSVEKILALARAGIANTGYEDLSLLSLCASDYPKIGELLTQLVYDLSPDRVAVSLPSLRFDSFFIELANKIKEIKKTGLTFALEAATQRLRDVINKGASDADLIALTEKLWDSGWRSVKIYFMVGLPTETWEDVQAIPELVRRLKRQHKGKADVKVNVTPFIPKAQTPFQWEPFAPAEELTEKINYLHQHLKKSLHSNPVGLSLLEAAFSRGDRRLAPILVTAWERGAKFDQWQEHFQFNLWQQVFQDHELELAAYSCRRFPLEARLPWDHIDLGLTKEFLLSEWEKAQRGELTPDCARNSCHDCGVCDAEQLAGRRQSLADFQPRRASQRLSPNIPMVKIRLKYTKNGATTLLSHLDLVRVFRRAMRRADLPLCYTQGFSPQPKISFGIPLSVGVASTCELVDLELARPVDLAGLKEKLQPQLPVGIEIIEIKQVRLEETALTKGAFSVTYEADFSSQLTPAALTENVRKLLLSEALPFTRVRDKRVQELNLRPFIKSLQLDFSDDQQPKIKMELIYNERGTVKPEEVLPLILGEPVTFSRLCRVNVEKLWGGSFV